MSVTLISGRPGTGKTFWMTKHLFKSLAKTDLKIYCNYSLKKEVIEKLLPKNAKGRTKDIIYWKRLTDLEDVKEGIIYMDETHVYMNSRRWKDLPEEMERLLAQHRKRGLHIVGTVQSPNRIDTIFRELVDFWYVMENRYLFFVKWEFNIDDDKQKKFALSKRWIWKNKKIYEMYDTLEGIENAK